MTSPSASRIALFYSDPETGDHREYNRVHYSARKNRSTHCERCCSDRNLDMALLPAENHPLFRDPKTGCLYSTDSSAYVTLCRACHKKMDAVEGRPYCRHGHPYSANNTSVKPDGSRRCLTCHRQQEALRLLDPAALDAKRIRQRVNRKPLTPQQHARKMELQRQRRSARSARFEYGESGAQV